MPDHATIAEPSMRKSEKGVTLIELMTVMLVLGILSAIAIPSYRRYLIRAQRSDATTALLRLQTAEEKYLLQYGSYTSDLTAVPTSGGLGLASANSERGFYVLEVKPGGTGYSATAKPISGNGQSDDTKCAVFTVTEIGKKTAADTGGTDRTTECWR
jgi:type IV pilus assembly protein PilE